MPVSGTEGSTDERFNTRNRYDLPNPSQDVVDANVARNRPQGSRPLPAAPDQEHAPSHQRPPTTQEASRFPAEIRRRSQKEKHLSDDPPPRRSTNDSNLDDSRKAKPSSLLPGRSEAPKSFDGGESRAQGRSGAENKLKKNNPNPRPKPQSPESPSSEFSLVEYGSESEGSSDEKEVIPDPVNQPVSHSSESRDVQPASNRTSPTTVPPVSRANYGGLPPASKADVRHAPQSMVPNRVEGQRQAGSSEFRPPRQSGSSSASSYAATLRNNHNAHLPTPAPIHDKFTEGRRSIDAAGPQSAAQPENLPSEEDDVFEGSSSESTPSASPAQQESAPLSSSGGAGFTHMIGSALGFGQRSSAAPKDTKMEKELNKAKAKIQTLENTLDQTLQVQHSLNIDLQKSIHDARSNSGRLRSSEQENHRLKENIQSLNHELNSVTRKYEDAKSLSETRRKELVGSQVFLTKADALSISELGTKVNNLNEEVFQAAAALGESIIRRNWEISHEELKQHAHVSSQMIGSELANIIFTEGQKADSSPNALLVQIVLQVFLTEVCVSKVRRWSSDPVLDQFLQDIYGQIRHTTDQAVSGRWRALTRAQVKYDSSGWTNEVSNELFTILKVASWDVSSSETSQESFNSKLATIFKAILDVRVALGELFTSADVEVGAPALGTPFDGRLMEEEYGDEGREVDPEETVLATSRLGLFKIAPAAPPEVVLAPKVILGVSLTAALQPPPPRPARGKAGRKRDRDEIDSRDRQGGGESGRGMIF